MRLLRADMELGRGAYSEHFVPEMHLGRKSDERLSHRVDFEANALQCERFGTMQFFGLLTQ